MDNPRVLLAIALSFLILLIWQAWMEDYGPRPQPAQQAAPRRMEGECEQAGLTQMGCSFGFRGGAPP